MKASAAETEAAAVYRAKPSPETEAAAVAALARVQELRAQYIAALNAQEAAKKEATEPAEPSETAKQEERRSSQPSKRKTWSREGRRMIAGDACSIWNCRAACADEWDYSSGYVYCRLDKSPCKKDWKPNQEGGLFIAADFVRPVLTKALALQEGKDFWFDCDETRLIAPAQAVFYALVPEIVSVADALESIDSDFWKELDSDCPRLAPWIYSATENVVSDRGVSIADASETEPEALPPSLARAPELIRSLGLGSYVWSYEAARELLKWEAASIASERAASSAIWHGYGLKILALLTVAADPMTKAGPAEAARQEIREIKSELIDLAREASPDSDLIEIAEQIELAFDALESGFMNAIQFD